MSDEKRSGPIRSSRLKLTTSVRPLGEEQRRATSIGARPQDGHERQGENVALSKKDRANHTHIIGSTGTGKSKFIELLIRQDVADRNCGLCLIDPHGSLYDEIVAYTAQVSPSLADRFILFNPAGEDEQIIGFNPIPHEIEHFDYTLQTLVSACLKAWGQDSTDSTPRITKWLENIFYPIIAKRLTLVESAPLVNIHNRNERAALLSNISNDSIIGDWRDFESLSLTQQQQQIEGAGNRLRKFLRNGIIRNIIGQSQRALDFAQVMAEGKIVLVNLSSQAKISYENAQLLGIMLVNEIFRVAKLRDPRDRKLKPFYLYIDEFGQFITRDIARALEECRKYKLFMVLAHQHLAQLKKEDEYLYASVLTNCKNKVVFGGLSKEDADVMTDEVMTGFVNLKSIKDEMYTTRVRHIEETRTVQGHSIGVTRGLNESETLAESESLGRMEGESQSRGTVVTETIGESLTIGTSETTGESIGKGTTRGQSDTRGRSHGITEGTSETKTEGWNSSVTHTDTRGTSVGRNESATRGKSTGRSQSDASTHTEGSNEGETVGESHSHTSMRGQSQTHSRMETEGTTESRGHNESAQWERNHVREGYGESQNSGSSHSTAHGSASSSSQSEGETHGTNRSRTTGTNRSDSRSHTEGTSETDTESRTEGRSFSEQQSHSVGVTEGMSGSKSIGRSRAETRTENQSYTDSFSESETRTESTQHGVSKSTGTSASRAESQQESRSRSSGRTTTEGKSRGTTHGSNEGWSAGETESVVPFLRPEEYTELSNRTFWTKDELHYMAAAAIKNQDTGEAFVKIGGNEPVRVKVEHVKDAPYSPRLTPRRIDAFRRRVFEKNSRYYTPVQEARREYEERQRVIFGEPLRFDERPLLTEGVVDIEAQGSDDDQSPFEQ